MKHVRYLAFAVIGLAAFAWRGDAQQAVTSARADTVSSVKKMAADISTPAPCAVDPDWIRSPSLPNEVPGTRSMCDFNQFAWQSFLYLVQPTAKGSRVLNFESWMPSYGIFVAAGQHPIPFGNRPPDPCTTPASAFGKATGEDPFFFSNLVKQAGVAQQLIAPDGRLVYYSIAINEPGYDMIVGCDLYRSQCAGPLKPQNPGIDLIAQYPNLAFPDGAVELKGSWKVLSNKEVEAGLFHTVSGLIQRPSDGKSCQTVTLGLVGLHIVSKTPKTRGLVWASFEHRNNAPPCSNLNALPPLGEKWNFFDPAKCENCTTNIYQPGHPAQVCRMHPQGDPTIGIFPDGQDCDEDPNQFICQEKVRAMLAESTNAIRQINDSAWRQIKQAGGAIDPVWANYELIGNVWTRDNIIPPQLQVQVGSLSAANTTMETYVQNGASGRTAANNCFSCHNQTAAKFGKQLPPIGLSRIFDRLRDNTGGCQDGKLPKICAPYYGNAGPTTTQTEARP